LNNLRYVAKLRVYDPSGTLGTGSPANKVVITAFGYGCSQFVTNQTTSEYTEVPGDSDTATETKTVKKAGRVGKSAGSPRTTTRTAKENQQKPKDFAPT
jgi:hypothetical protein